MQSSTFTFFAPSLLLILAVPVAADEVTKWNDTANRVSFTSGLTNFPNGPVEARIMAMVHVAIHDALNSMDRRYRPYALNTPIVPGASPEAAIAAAAHGVLIHQYNLLLPLGVPSQRVALDTAYASSLAPIPDGPAKTTGIRLGQRAAEAILNLRANDGFSTMVFLDSSYPQGKAPGEYRFTPPFDFIYAPKWGTVTPFVLREAAQFRADRPYRINSRAYTEDFNEVKSLGGDGVSIPSTRTAEQTDIALFWLESSVLQWNRIARTVSAPQGLNLWENARLFGLLNLSLADGYIANIESKIHYNFWRPITAIREAATDDNPNTVADPAWTPLAITPPNPDHDSGHSLAGGAAAQVLERFFGWQRVSFRTCSTSLPAGKTCNDASPVTRFYTSFSQAAEENGVSRIYVGFHFRKAVIEGIKHGRQIANRAFNLFLRPTQ